MSRQGTNATLLSAVARTSDPYSENSGSNDVLSCQTLDKFTQKYESVPACKHLGIVMYERLCVFIAEWLNAYQMGLDGQLNRFACV